MLDLSILLILIALCCWGQLIGNNTKIPSTFNQKDCRIHTRHKKRLSQRGEERGDMRMGERTELLVVVSGRQTKVESGLNCLWRFPLMSEDAPPLEPQFCECHFVEAV